MEVLSLSCATKPCILLPSKCRPDRFIENLCLFCTLITIPSSPSARIQFAAASVNAALVFALFLAVFLLLKSFASRIPHYEISHLLLTTAAELCPRLRLGDEPQRWQSVGTVGVGEGVRRRIQGRRSGDGAGSCYRGVGGHGETVGPGSAGEQGW